MCLTSFTTPVEVQMTGIEPARGFPHQPLKLARLPISPHLPNVHKRIAWESNPQTISGHALAGRCNTILPTILSGYGRTRTYEGG